MGVDNDARWKGCEVSRSDDLKTEESEGALRRSEVKAWNSWRIFEREENTSIAKNFVSLRIPKA